MRFQDPALERSKAGKRSRAYWFIRPVVPEINAAGELVRDRKSIRLGFTDEVTKSEAKKAKQAVMATINSGSIVIQSQVPFAFLLEEFERVKIPRLSATTADKYRTHIANHIKPAFSKHSLLAINKAAIEAWLARKEEEGLSHATRCDLRSIMASIFSFASDRRMWDGENPAHNAYAGVKKAVRDKRILRTPAFHAFLAQIEDTAVMSTDQAVRIVLISMMASLRISEVLGLQWGDLDAIEKSIDVTRRFARGDLAGTKTEASRRRRIIGPLADELAELRGNRPSDAHIFIRPDGRIPDDRDLQQHVFRPAAERAKIYYPGFGMHAFRRLSITWKQHAGATPIEAMQQAGHTSLSMTMLYTLEDQDRERAVVDKVHHRATTPDRAS